MMNAIATHSRDKLGGKKVEKKIPQPKLLTKQDYVILTPPKIEILNCSMVKSILWHLLNLRTMT